MAGLRNHFDIGIGHKISDGFGSLLSHQRSVVTEVVEKLAKDVVCRDNADSFKLSADLHGLRMPLIEPMRQRDPVKGVGENLPHGLVDRLGVP